jgi:hypothetical protein
MRKLEAERAAHMARRIQELAAGGGAMLAIVPVALLPAVAQALRP